MRESICIYNFIRITLRLVIYLVFPTFIFLNFLFWFSMVASMYNPHKIMEILLIEVFTVTLIDLLQDITNWSLLY